MRKAILNTCLSLLVGCNSSGGGSAAPAQATGEASIAFQRDGGYNENDFLSDIASISCVTYADSNSMNYSRISFKQTDNRNTKFELGFTLHNNGIKQARYDLINNSTANVSMTIEGEDDALLAHSSNPCELTISESTSNVKGRFHCRLATPDTIVFADINGDFTCSKVVMN